MNEQQGGVNIGRWCAPNTEQWERALGRHIETTDSMGWVGIGQAQERLGDVENVDGVRDQDVT